MKRLRIADLTASIATQTMENWLWHRNAGAPVHVLHLDRTLPALARAGAHYCGSRLTEAALRA